MRARVQALTFPKTEHTTHTNEDALGYSASAGLFAVTDGVGSASFSGQWARVLVDHCLSAPLLGDDPFELEWWLRRAQRHYDTAVPRPESLPAFAQEKARQGAASTLATLRVWRVSPAAVHVEALACGDSCVILRRAGSRAPESFPLTSAGEFSTLTQALPARARYFDRRRHRVSRLTTTLHAGDVVVLATDAVAKAIVGAGGGRLGDAAAAFALVAAATDADWPDLVQRWRGDGALADDDATALVIEPGREGEELGQTDGPAPALVAEREAELAAALAEQRREGVAIAYGDGSYHVAGRLDPLTVQRARLVADAIAAVRVAIMRSLASRGESEPLSSVWEQWAPLLDCEPSAANLRHSLQQLCGPLPPPVWPHEHAFSAAVSRGDAMAAAALAPPGELSHLLTDGERELLRGAHVGNAATAPGGGPTPEPACQDDASSAAMPDRPDAPRGAPGAALQPYLPALSLLPGGDEGR